MGPNAVAWPVLPAPVLAALVELAEDAVAGSHPRSVTYRLVERARAAYEAGDRVDGARTALAVLGGCVGVPVGTAEGTVPLDDRERRPA